MAKMKMLAFSDWRIQSNLLLKKTIEKEKPDLILYAGDDLERVVPHEGKVYIKTFNHFIEVDLDNIQEFLDDKRVAINPLFDDLFSNIEKLNPRFLDNPDVPFYYVIGSDDIILKKDDNTI